MTAIAALKRYLSSGTLATRIITISADSADDIGDDVGDNGKIDQGRELLAERRRDRRERQKRLHHAENDHSSDGGAEFIDLGKEGREHALLGGGFAGLCDGELPAEQRAEARHHRQRHDDRTNGRVEHLGVGEGKRSCRLRKLRVGYDALDDGGREDVDDRRPKRAEHAGKRHVALRDSRRHPSSVRPIPCRGRPTG